MFLVRRPPPGRHRRSSRRPCAGGDWCRTRHPCGHSTHLITAAAQESSQRVVHFDPVRFAGRETSSAAAPIDSGIARSGAEIFATCPGTHVAVACGIESRSYPASTQRNSGHLSRRWTVANLRWSFLVSLLLIAPPAMLWGQESVRTPNDNGAGCPAGLNNTNVAAAIAAGRRMDIRVISGKVAALRTDDQGDISLSACQSGQTVTHSATTKLCASAVAKGFTCQGFFTGPFEACGPGQALSCCDATIDPTVRGVSMDCSIPGQGGATLARDPGAAGTDTGEKVQIGNSTPNTVNAVNTTTNGGNSITSDPLPQHLESLETNG